MTIWARLFATKAAVGTDAPNSRILANRKLADYFRFARNGQPSKSQLATTGFLAN